MDALDDFLRRVARRRRSVEWRGRAVAAVTCGAVTGLIGVVWVSILGRGESPYIPALAAPAGAVVAALVLHGRRRASAGRVAADADARLGTRDLLATARPIDPTDPDPFARAVRSRASATCAAFDSDEVNTAAGPGPTRRQRGAAVVLVLLCLLAAVAADEFAGAVRPRRLADAGDAASPSASEQSVTPTPAGASAAPPSLLPTPRAASRIGRESGHQSGATSSGDAAPAGRHRPKSPAAEGFSPSAAMPASSQEGDGTGAAAAPSGDHPDGPPPVVKASDRHETASPRASLKPTPISDTTAPAELTSAGADSIAGRTRPAEAGHASGGGLERNAPGGGDSAEAPRSIAPAGAERNSDGGTVGPAGSTPTVEPWRSDGWPSARDAALADVAAGRIGPEDRAMVRAYFER